MMHRTLGCLGAWAGEPAQDLEVVQCHHNYTEREKHFGKEVWLSRKGAIGAVEGRPG
jgi:tRNA-splicing ligase RtcB (3'-phosphate/5'-hydroxy nucleic acid ligase)